MAAVSLRAAYNSGIIDYALNGTQKYEKEAKEEEKIISRTEELMKSVINRIGEDNEPEDDENPIDFEKIKKKAKEEREGEEPIGIGTDGSFVDLSLWDYHIDGENNYGIILRSGYGSGGEDGYLGDIINGRIIGAVPQYILLEGEDEFRPVNSMFMTFYYNQDLVYAP